MRRVLPAWALPAALIVVAALAGVSVGIVVAPQRPPTFLAYCSLESGSGLFQCPPDSDRWVQAYWSGFQSVARWEGDGWRFQRPILGNYSTPLPALAWHEIPEGTR